MNEFTLSILAADKPFYEGSCTSIIVPTLQGQYGILAHHSNFIGAIVPGMLKFCYDDKEGSHEQICAVSAGLVKIEDNTVLVLVDSAEKPEEIDANRAMRALEQAKEEMLQKHSIREYYDAQTKIARAINRLKIKKNFQNK